MAVPVASFSFKANGLDVNFFDTSTNTPTSWAWTIKLGGETAETSTKKNPEISFLENGVYEVTLVATNADGASVPYKINLVFSDSPGVNLTIEDMVKAELPVGFEVTSLNLLQAIRLWQIYLQPFTNPLVPLEDMHDESKWPSLLNVLIAKLVIMDLLVQNYKKSVATSTVTGKGGLKKVETGPSSAEWYELKEGSSQSMSESGGFYDQLAREACLIAGRLGIYLPFCPKIKTVFPWILIKKSC